MKKTYDKENVIIDSVSSYLKYIESKSNNKKWFFRGEDRDYGYNKLMPSLYRKTVYYNSSDGKYNNALKEYERMSKDFYGELTNISQIDKDNFMALCQHHSIPTPLLDATTSPLVSLYFASQDDKNNSDGKVYMFNPIHFIYKNNSFLKYGIDLSSFPYLGDNYKNIVDDISNFIVSNEDKGRYFKDKVIPETLTDLRNYINFFDEDSKNEMKQAYSTIFNAKTFKDIYNSLIAGENDISTDNPGFVGKKYIEYIKNFEIEKHGKHFYQNGNLLMGGAAGVIGYADVFGFILWILRLCINNHGFFNPRKLQFYTTTSQKWDRVKAQSGIFLVIIPEGSYFPNNNNEIQFRCNRPKPDYELTIPYEYKKDIIKELDSMEINEKNLFLDIDHTAHYIVNNHFRK